jgi:hypothetical protein
MKCLEYALFGTAIPRFAAIGALVEKRTKAVASLERDKLVHKSSLDVIVEPRGEKGKELLDRVKQLLSNDPEAHRAVWHYLVHNRNEQPVCY